MIVHTLHSLHLYNKKVVFRKGSSEYCAIKMPMYSFQISFLERILCVWPSRGKKKKRSCIGQQQIQGFHIFVSWRYFILTQTGYNSSCRKLLSVCWHPRMPSLLTDWETHQWQFRTQSNGSIQMQCKWIFYRALFVDLFNSYSCSVVLDLYENSLQ